MSNIVSKSIDLIVTDPPYMFIIPRDNNNVRVNKGLIIFQNVGVFGVKTTTIQKINDYFTENYNISLKCATVTPTLFVKKSYLKKCKTNDIS